MSFLRKIQREYTIGEVAKLIGTTQKVVRRYVASGELKIDTNANIAEIVNVLKEMDMDTISPLMAFGTLQNLVDKVKK